MRGEEAPLANFSSLSGEIPPRARRRARHYNQSVINTGNTSACAEKRGIPRQLNRWLWKYLRVRGEEHSGVFASAPNEEIPPRARRRETNSISGGQLRGNTSACAEKSENSPSQLVINGKYLRVRGEEIFANCRPSRYLEIPPRARRRVFLNSNFSLSRCGFAYVLAKTCTQVKGRPCQ